MDCHKVAEKIRRIAQEDRETTYRFRQDLLEIADEIDPPKEKTLADVLNEAGTRKWTRDGTYEIQKAHSRVGYIVFGSKYVTFGTPKHAEVVIENVELHALSDYIKEKYEQEE